MVPSKRSQLPFVSTFSSHEFNFCLAGWNLNSFPTGEVNMDIKFIGVRMTPPGSSLLHPLACALVYPRVGVTVLYLTYGTTGAEGQRSQVMNPDR